MDTLALQAKNQSEVGIMPPHRECRRKTSEKVERRTAVITQIQGSSKLCPPEQRSGALQRNERVLPVPFMSEEQVELAVPVVRAGAAVVEATLA